MNRSLRILDRVQVKSPCTEDWNEMVGNDEVRFCSHCSKHVHNLSAMTRREAEELVLKSNGNLCIRYLRRPEDQQIVTLPDWMDRPSLRRLVLPVAAGVMAVALNTAPSLAQRPQLPKQEHSRPAKQPDQKPAKLGDGSGNTTLKGTVQYEQKEAIQDAEITLINLKTETTQIAISDEDGHYQFTNLAEGTYKIEVSAEGFQRFIVDELRIRSGQQLQFNPQLEVGAFMGILTFSFSLEEMVKHRDDRIECAFDNPDSQAFFEDLEEGNQTGVLRRLKQGISPNLRNGCGETALMVACEDKGLILLLLQYGADVKAQSMFGATPLMFSMVQNDPAIPKVLIQRGAEVNAADQDGRTALMIAAAAGKIKYLKLLLTAGADLNAKDKIGQTALNYAIAHDEEKAIAFLKLIGAKASPPIVEAEEDE
ncbi:MAG: ankyrin repeat domain-containing protein [Acidobacteria bacterium]|nr:ankyrin repeat domain-containing protein [Acidobacteriota bacterium]